MFYVCDIKEDRVGIKDTVDSKVEYYSLEEVETLNKKGVGIVGFSGYSFCYPQSRYSQLVTYDEDTMGSIYIGEYLGEGRWTALGLIDSKGYFVSVQRSQFFTRKYLRDSDRVFYLSPNICSFGMSSYSVEREPYNGWHLGLLYFRNSSYFISCCKEDTTDFSRVLLFYYDFFQSKEFGNITVDKPVKSKKCDVTDVIAPVDVSLGNLKQYQVGTNKMIVLSRHFSVGDNMLYFLVARMDNSGQYSFNNSSNVCSVLELIDLVQSDVNNFYNVTADEKGFTYSGIDGTVRFEYNKLLYIYGRECSKKDKLRVLKMKLSGVDLPQVTENGVVVRAVCNNDILYFGEGCKYLLGVFDASVISGVVKIVFSEAFLWGWENSLLSIIDEDKILNGMIRIETHSRHFREVARVLPRNMGIDIDFSNSEPVCALCLLLETKALRYSGSCIRVISYSRQINSRAFKTLIDDRQVIEAMWDLFYNQTYKQFRILRNLNTMSDDIVSTVRNNIAVFLSGDGIVSSAGIRNQVALAISDEFKALYSLQCFCGVYNLMEGNPIMQNRELELKKLLKEVYPYEIIGRK